jgi:hypothetical protein
MLRGRTSILLRATVAGSILTLSACSSEPTQVQQQEADQQQEAAADKGQIPSLPVVSPETAVAGFDGDHVDRSLARLVLSIQEHPAEIRKTALDNLQAPDEAVRFAALLALAATAEAGESLEALRPFLDSGRRSERLLAASRLASQGEKSVLPILIEVLDSEETLGFSIPPEPAWMFARRTLLRHTDRDFGLRAAEDAEAARRTRRAWDAWWTNNASSLRWDEKARRFKAEKSGSGGG